ncbi:MAG TPA: PD-(D/E)XK nuclease family protein [Tepidisphaeraceae bacterium]|nr:PD-(D/E)XK nuclease family protein [Tepidisphaeraceae bacterium]
MSLRFIIGRAGTGKSKHCFASIVSTLKERPLGEEILFLLPRQATFDAQRRLACGGELAGFCGVRVESFDELAAELMAECGGKAIPQVSTLGRQMILGHLLRKNQNRLKYFSKVATYPSLAARLEGALSEFDRCGTEPQKLAEAAASFDQSAEGAAIDSQVLSAKLHDLQLLYEAYCQYLGQERLDPKRRLEHLLKCIDSSGRVKRATIYVDEFLEFTDLERRMLARLAKRAKRVEVTLLMDPAAAVVSNPEKFPDEGSLFHRTEWTYRRLRKALAEEGVAVEEAILLAKPMRVRGAALVNLEKAFFSNASGLEADGKIQLIEAPDRRAEVEAAAREVRALISSGYRLRDIALLVRRLEDYVDLLESTLREHGIPFFVDHRRTMAHHPLLAVIRSVLKIALKNWPHDAVMQLIKSGLAGISLADADCLENYVLEHRLRGSVWAREEPWTWCRRIARGGEDDATSALPDPSPAMDALRKKIGEGILLFTKQFPTAKTTGTIREMATALFGVLGRFGVRQTISKWIEECREKTEHEWAAEHEQIWTEVSSLFQQMVELLGNEQVTLEEFAQIVEAGLETFDLALAPPTADQLLVGAIDRTRAGPIKAVLLLGWSDGLFPSSAREMSLLSDAERSELQRREIAIEPDADRQRLDEDLLAYIALTRASEHVYVSRPACDEAKRASAPSPYWIRLQEVFPKLEVRVLPRNEEADAAAIGTPRQLLTSLLHWARDGGKVENDRPWGALYQWLATYPTKNDAIDSIRFRAWKALSYANDSNLSKQMGERLFAAPLRASVSQVEMFATCPFKHFAHYGLGLRERVEEEHLEIDLDRAFHATLSDLVAEMLRNKTDWSKLSVEAAAEMVEKYTQQVGQTLAGELMLSNARNRYLLKRIQDTLEQIIAQQREMAARSDLKTMRANIQYGSTESPLTALRIRTPRGKEIELRGQIDRVDILEKEAAFAVFDYRLYADPLNLTRVRHGLSLGLLASLAIVQEQSQKLTKNEKLSPAAAFYLRLLRQLEKVDHPDLACGPDKAEFHLATKPRGIFNEDYFSALDKSCEGGPSAMLAARVNKDGSLGSKYNMDGAEAEEFSALLKEVRKQLGKLGDQIIEGDIGIRPYRLGTITPCSSCKYRSVCRFDPSINRYRNIQNMRRDDLLKQLVEEHRE